MTRKLVLLMAATLLLTVSGLAIEYNAQKELPPVQDRMRTQRLDPFQLSGIHQRAATEELSVFFTQGERSEVTVGLNAFRLFGKRADTFDGYRSIPWYLRNVQFSLTMPTQNANGDNLGFELKWGLYRKAHKWDERWDSYFHTDFPPNLSDVTDDCIESEEMRLIYASIRVDSLLLEEGNDGFSLLFSGDRVAGDWERFSGTVIGSHHLGGWLATVNGSARYLSDQFGAQISGQVSREIWPYRWQSGGLTLALTGSAEYVKDWDWSTTASVALPLLEQARFLLAFQVSDKENRLLTGFTYQFIPVDHF